MKDPFCTEHKTVQVKNGDELFWREKKLYWKDCVVPQPHSLQNAKAEKLTRKLHGNHGRRRSWPLPPPLGCLHPFKSLAGTVADMSATFQPDSQKSAHLADRPPTSQNKFVLDTLFCVGDCRLSPNFL